MRTTIDIDDPILKEVKRLRKREGRSLGRLVSDLLAESLARRRNAVQTEKAFAWIQRSMGARVDLGDKDLIHSILDAERDGGDERD
ncbi:antitoxin [Candidatus Binatia bacterium]|nr:antitoxin [Candidatus Binatia bacterium]